MKNKIKLVTVAFLFVSILQSCKAIKAISLIYSKEATYKDYSNNEKDIRFVNMVHISTKEFYKDVINKVTEAKNKDYVLFYEYVDFDLATDLEKRKIRKMIGFIPSPEGYKKVLKSIDDDDNLMVQDNDQFLNLVNNKDYPVDITPSEIIKQYETKFGEIILSEEDKNTPINEELKRSLPKKKVQSIILDFRNKYLANKVEHSEFSKIIILYGADHRTGLFKELKKLNPKWSD